MIAKPIWYLFPRSKIRLKVTNRIKQIVSGSGRNLVAFNAKMINATGAKEDNDFYRTFAAFSGLINPNQ